MNKIVTGLLAVVVVLVIGIAGRMVYFSNEGGSTSAGMGEAAIGGPFELVASDGTTWTEEKLLGRYSLIYFGFTFCPDVCPTELGVMGAAMDELAADEAALVQPLFITVDPERDSLELVSDYVQHFHPKMVGLTGTKDQTDAAARAYRVYFSKVPDEDGDPDAYLVDHSSIVYLMGPNGKYVRHFSYGTPPETMAEGIRAVLAEG